MATSPDESSEERSDRSLAEQVVEQARADGKQLVGPGGLMSDLTKQVLETGMEVDLGYATTRLRAARAATHGAGRGRGR